VSNQLQIFKSPQFGPVRWVKVNDKDYAVAKDIAIALGYKDTINAIKQHCKGVVKHHIPTNGGEQLMNVIPEGRYLQVNSKVRTTWSRKIRIMDF
jgi:prophage antirepressor-like protein